MLDINKDNISVDVRATTASSRASASTVKDPEGGHFRERQPQIVGHANSHGAPDDGVDGDRDAARQGPNIEPRLHDQRAGRGRRAISALKTAGKEKGVHDRRGRRRLPRRQERRAGVIGATSQQYPLLMASMGVDAVAAYRRTAPSRSTPKASISSTRRAALITDHPVPGVPSIDTKEGLAKCWG